LNSARRLASSVAGAELLAAALAASAARETPMPAGSTAHETASANNTPAGVASEPRVMTGADRQSHACHHCFDPRNAPDNKRHTDLFGKHARNK
jgi:hypothetical protein